MEGTPISSVLIGFSTINHPFWGYPQPLGNLTRPSGGPGENWQTIKQLTIIGKNMCTCTIRYAYMHSVYIYI